MDRQWDLQKKKSALRQQPSWMPQWLSYESLLDAQSAANDDVQRNIENGLEHIDAEYLGHPEEDACTVSVIYHLLKTHATTGFFFRKASLSDVITEGGTYLLVHCVLNRVCKRRDNWFVTLCDTRDEQHRNNDDDFLHVIVLDKKREYFFCHNVQHWLSCNLLLNLDQMTETGLIPPVSPPHYLRRIHTAYHIAW